MEPHSPKPEETPTTQNTADEENEYTVASLDIVPIDGVDTIFVKLKNLKTKRYLIRTPKEIVLNDVISFGLSKKELRQVSYIAGYEHNAQGACTLDGDDAP